MVWFMFGLYEHEKVNCTARTIHCYSDKKGGDKAEGYWRLEAEWEKG